MRVLSLNEVSTVSGGALIVGQNLNLGLATGGQANVLSRLVGNAGVSASTDKLVYLGREKSTCGCNAPS